MQFHLIFYVCATNKFIIYFLLVGFIAHNFIMISLINEELDLIIFLIYTFWLFYID